MHELLIDSDGFYLTYKDNDVSLHYQIKRLDIDGQVKYKVQHGV